MGKNREEQMRAMGIRLEKTIYNNGEHGMTNQPETSESQKRYDQAVRYARYLKNNPNACVYDFRAHRDPLPTAPAVSLEASVLLLDSDTFEFVGLPGRDPLYVPTSGFLEDAGEHWMASGVWMRASDIQFCQISDGILVSGNKVIRGPSALQVLHALVRLEREIC